MSPAARTHYAARQRALLRGCDSLLQTNETPAASGRAAPPWQVARRIAARRAAILRLHRAHRRHHPYVAPTAAAQTELGMLRTRTPSPGHQQHGKNR